MQGEDSARRPGIGRRSVLGGLAGLCAGGLVPFRGGAGATPDGYDGPVTGHTSSHHPGEPLFAQVGDAIFNPAHVGEYGVFDVRDNLAPRLPEPTPESAGYDADAFSWSVADRPADSEAELTFGETVPDDRPRWSTGKRHTADFEPDAPGRYVFELDAPDGTHEWTWHVFPAGDGSPPRLALDGEFDADADAFVIEPEASVATDSDATVNDVETVFLADDRDPLATEAIQRNGSTARIPLAALDGESARLHAAAWDGHARSMIDTVELQPDGSITFPNRPPEWTKEGVMYQIFTRSWAGAPGETTMADLTDGVEYLDQLGVDMVWLTPVLPDEATARQFDQELLAEPYRASLGGTLSGGGPHGYGSLDYFGISPDLVPEGVEPIEAYRTFVEACHDHDIKVIFDLVISHCGRSHPLFQDTIASQGTEAPHPDLEYPAVDSWDGGSQFFDWHDRIDLPNTYKGVGVAPRPHATGFFGLRILPNFNYNSLAVREHMLAVADFWSGTVGVDGFRCDIAWGVPLSLWREIRAVVRDNDSEFLMLDETVPKDPQMAENAFDMHFDTEGFTVHAQSVAAGEAEPELLAADVRDRATQGVPPHSLVLNLIENHDEHRLLNQAVVDLFDPDHDSVSDEEWEAGAHRQRMCWAAGVVLPGVPGVYYGQERQISRYGEGRHRGVDDPRGRSGGDIDVGADVRPGGRQRAFMNWEEYPEEHLAFYEDVIDLYHDLDVLKPDAALRTAFAFTSDEVLAVGRDASRLDDVDGPERVIALLNFGTGTAEVTVRPSIDNTDLLTGERVEDQVEFRPGTVLEVEDILVLEAPDLYSVGSLVADFEPPEGTDDGPGGYEYPTDESLEPGSLDVAGFSVNETDEEYQFRVELSGELTNPEDRRHGLSHQHLQVYVRDPAVEEGPTEARTGVNAEFSEPYQYRIVADGADGVRVEAGDGTEVATGALSTNPVTNEFLVSFPKQSLDVALAQAEIAPLMLGYDPEAPGNVSQVAPEAGEGVFGGASTERAPNVIDTGFPATFPNEETLAYGEERATIPYAAVITEFEAVEQFDLPTGDGYGPGSYEVPTGSDYYAEAWDIDEFAVFESRDAVRLEFTMAAEPENPWGFGSGFSHPFFQVYLHVPGESPAALSGREGTNVSFRAPYHYRVVVHGEGLEAIETPEGVTVSRDVEVETDDRTIAIEFPTAAVNWDTDDRGVGIAPTVMPYDGFGEGGLRSITAEAGEHAIGGGNVAGIDPAVMDMVVPDGMDRASVLSAYDDENPAQLPFVGLGPMEDVVEPRQEGSDNGDGADSDGDDTDSGGDGTDGDEEGSDAGGGDTDGQDSDSGGGGTEDGDGTGAESEEDGAGGQADGSEAGAQEDDGTGTDDEDGPGFGPGAALAGLGGAGYLLKQRLGTGEGEE